MSFGKRQHILHFSGLFEQSTNELIRVCERSTVRAVICFLSAELFSFSARLSPHDCYRHAGPWRWFPPPAMREPAKLL